MTAKISAARRAAFLKALAETGNVTVSAERAKVSRRWVQTERKADAGFDEACEAALRAARDRLHAHPEHRPPRGWGFLDGEELVVRGTGGGAPGGRRVQIARARVRQWTPRVEDRFLQALAATSNVKAAVAEAGMTKSSAYCHRKRWPAFARKWDEAIVEASGRIAFGLLENAENLFSSPERPPEIPMGPMTVKQAIHIVHMHKHLVHGIGNAPGKSWQPPPSLDAKARARILRTFEAVERRWAMREEDKARGSG